jgi:hypothetical protein
MIKYAQQDAEPQNKNYATSLKVARSIPDAIGLFQMT